MTDFRKNLVMLSGTPNSYVTSDSDAWFQTRCGHCGVTGQHLVVASGYSGNKKWLLCIACEKPSTVNEGTPFPGAKPLRVPKGLPADEERVWEEVRSCLSVGGHTAAVMLCRKLLFHLAVANGLSSKNDKDRAPTFMEAVDHLETAGVITTRMRPWVDRIKDYGNELNHELGPVAAEAALDVATFTEQLLVLAFELDALMTNPLQAGSDDAG